MSAKWREDNKEYHLARLKKWREENKEYVRLFDKKWYNDLKKLYPTYLSTCVINQHKKCKNKKGTCKCSCHKENHGQN